MLPALVHIQSGVASCMPGHVESLTVVHRSGVGAPWSHRRGHPQPLIYTLSSCLNPPPTPIPHPPPPPTPPASWLQPDWGCVWGRRRGRGLPSLHLCSAWGPGNLGLEGEEVAPKQEMLLWAPAAGGQGAKGGGGGWAGAGLCSG